LLFLDVPLVTYNKCVGGEDMHGENFFVS